MPIVSVIVPSYNAEPYIGECVSSILNQSLSDIEVIVADDGSTDATLSVLNTFEDPRMTVLALEHQNAGAARNRGMKLASGKYLYFIDADDFITRDCLEKAVSAAETNNAELVVFGSHYLDDKSKSVSPIDFTMVGVERNRLLKGSELPNAIFQSFVGWPWDKLFSRSLIEKNGLRFQEQRSSNDALFVFLALARAKSLICLNDDLVTHRTNNLSSLEHTRSKSWECALNAMRAIGDSLASDITKREVLTSYANWISHFSYWNMSTLDSGALTPEVARDFFSVIQQHKLDSDSYFTDADREFASLADMGRDELLTSYVRLRHRGEEWAADLSRGLSDTAESNRRLTEELDGANRRIRELEGEVRLVRSSHSYRLGNTLIKPLSAIKRLLKQGE